MDSGLRILILFLFLTGTGLSQDNFLNSLAFLDEEKLAEEKLELLAQVTQIDLNEADSMELMNSGLFSVTQIGSLLKYKEQNGELLSLHELQVIEGFEVGDIIRIQNHVTIGLAGVALAEPSGFLLMRSERTLEEDQGSRDGVFRGSPYRTMLRVKLATKKGVEFGFLLEKDKGEKLIWEPEKQLYGTDFQSGYLMIKGKEILDQLVIGDFSFQSGEGLILGSGLSLGKNYETILSLKKAFSGIKPYSSSGESRFFRGLGLCLSLSPKLRVNLLGSSMRNDAVLYQNEAQEKYFKSIQYTGLHRSMNELRSRKTVRESLIAINIDHNFRQTQWGVNMVLSKWSIPRVEKTGIEHLNSTSALTEVMTSVYLSKTWKNAHIFNEYGITTSGELGGLSGLMLNLAKFTELGAVFRHYPASFDNRHGGAFGEYYRNANERGFYIGISHYLNRQFRMSAYVDAFRFPWLKHGVSFPSSGNELLVNGQLKSKNGTTVNIRWRQDLRQVNRSGHEIGQQQKSNYLVSMSYPISNTLKLDIRIQGSHFLKNESTTAGLLTSMELTNKWRKSTISARVILFDTDDFDNRQYIYERDLLYSFSLPAYQGNGFRWYLNLKYSISPRAVIWCRLSRTTYLDQSEVGTGPGSILGNRRTGVKFQLRYQIFG